MLLHDASRYIAPERRQMFDTLAREAMQGRADEQRREAIGMARKALSKPAGDRMNVGN